MSIQGKHWASFSWAPPQHWTLLPKPSPGLAGQTQPKRVVRRMRAAQGWPSAFSTPADSLSQVGSAGDRCCAPHCSTSLSGVWRMDESSLTRLAASGELDTTEWRATLERGLHGWQEQARKICMKFKRRTRSGTWDEITRAHHGWREGRDLGAMADNRLN